MIIQETSIDKKLDNISNELIYDAALEGKEVTLTSGGSCMAPLLKEGDRISFKKVDMDKLKRTDIAVFKQKDKLISHRFVKVIEKDNRRYIITRSDVFRKYDNPISEENFLGRITKSERPDKAIHFDNIMGKLKSYVNIFAAPLYSKQNFNKDDEIRERLKQIASEKLCNDKKIRLELQDVLRSFSRNNIKVMLLNSPYPGEIEILAKTDNWPAIKDILQNLGFELEEGDHDFWRLCYLYNRIMFKKGGTRLNVKFNIWHLDFPCFADDMWEGAREIEINGEKLCAPSLVDTLLIACANLARRNYAGLVWFSDIKEIIEGAKGALDWDAVIKRAKEKNVNCVVYYALYYSRRLLSYRIPNDTLEKIKPSFIKRMLHRFFWDEKVILWKKEGYPSEFSMAFQAAALLFGGKMSFKPKKLFKIALYSTNVIAHFIAARPGRRLRSAGF